MSDITQEDLVQGLERSQLKCELSLAMMVIELVKIGCDPQRLANALDRYAENRVDIREQWNKSMANTT